MTSRQDIRWAAAGLAAVLCVLSAAPAAAGEGGGPDSYQVLILRDEPTSGGLDLSINVDPPRDGGGNDLSGAGLNELTNPRETERQRRIPEDWELQPPNQGRFRGPRTD